MPELLDVDVEVDDTPTGPLVVAVVLEGAFVVVAGPVVPEPLLVLLPVLLLPPDTVWMGPPGVVPVPPRPDTVVRPAAISRETICG